MFRKKRGKIGSIFISCILILLILIVFVQEEKEEVLFITEKLEEIASQTPMSGAIQSFLPIIAFANEGGEGKKGVVEKSVLAMFPLCSYSLDQTEMEIVSEDRDTFALLMAAESQDEELRLQEEPQEEVEIAPEVVGEILVPTNEPILEEDILVVREQQYSYDWNVLQDINLLQSTFYTVTPNTNFTPQMLNLDQLNMELAVDKNKDGPQILIYHTHSQEAYADSVAGDESMTVQGVGDELARILTQEYGYEVLHHTGKYDVDTRDDAYARALPDVEQILKDNPSIEVVIDLHRDAAIEGRDMVVDIDGKETAKFMFFNGLSRTNKGEISYLPNENLQENLAFSFQMQVKAGEFYPGLTRKIYVREYRYNMHVNGKTLLIELGDTSNTLEQALNACIPIAHMLDMVLEP